MSEGAWKPRAGPIPQIRAGIAPTFGQSTTPSLNARGCVLFWSYISTQCKSNARRSSLTSFTYNPVHPPSTNTFTLLAAEHSPALLCIALLSFASVSLPRVQRIYLSLKWNTITLPHSLVDISFVKFEAPGQKNGIVRWRCCVARDWNRDRHRGRSCRPGALKKLRFYGAML